MVTVVTEFAIEGILHGFLHADDLVMMSKTIKGLQMEGGITDHYLGKTKEMVSGSMAGVK